VAREDLLYTKGEPRRQEKVCSNVTDGKGPALRRFPSYSALEKGINIYIFPVERGGKREPSPMLSKKDYGLFSRRGGEKPPRRRRKKGGVIGPCAPLPARRKEKKSAYG